MEIKMAGQKEACGSYFIQPHLILETRGYEKENCRYRDDIWRILKSSHLFGKDLVQFIFLVFFFGFRLSMFYNKKDDDNSSDFFYHFFMFRKFIISF